MRRGFTCISRQTKFFTAAVSGIRRRRTCSGFAKTIRDKAKGWEKATSSAGFVKRFRRRARRTIDPPAPWIFAGRSPYRRHQAQELLRHGGRKNPRRQRRRRFSMMLRATFRDAKPLMKFFVRCARRAVLIPWSQRLQKLHFQKPVIRKSKFAIDICVSDI